MMPYWKALENCNWRLRMPKKQKLELTWIGKNNRPKLEPRILIENPEKSYHATHKVSKRDMFDNMLIHGDNLLALKALEHEFSGAVDCVYIDPPFNTGQAFEHYDDGIEHSTWLSLMRDRLEILYKLLTNSGSLLVHIDDNELAYLTIMCDEIFGRNNRISIITFKQGSATGHKAINPGCVTNTNFILWYVKNKEKWVPHKVFTKSERKTRYNQFIVNKNDHYSKWRIIPLAEAFANFKGIEKKNIKKKVSNFEESLNQYVMENPESVIRLARPNYTAVSREAREFIDKSKDDPTQIFHLPRDGYSDMYFIRGERILFYSDTLVEIDQERVPGEPLTTLWDDISSHNLHNEGSVSFKKSKKPEALIKRVLELTTDEGDIVLDSFLGSGTTTAVAHKMNRRWIGIELGDHCEELCLPRMKIVIDGNDQSGITKTSNWQGGGGFRFYKLGPSLIKKDQWDNPVINSEFNPEMLAEAVCKLEGFTYSPTDDVYWNQGYSTETDFIYVTTQFMTKAMLTKISDEVGSHRSLLICCSAFKCNADEFPNLTIKKIPKAVLQKCEWDKDDYSLEIKNLPEAPWDNAPVKDEKAKNNTRKFGKENELNKQTDFFDMLSSDPDQD